MAEPFYGAAQAAIHHDRFGALAAMAAEDLLAALRPADLRRGTVVDLGCGSGILARHLLDAGYDVVGVDISPDMVDLARETAPGATVAVGSVHDVELPAGAVAVTAIGEVGNYAADARAGLDSLVRLARRVHDALVPGGTFLLDLSGPGRGGPDGSVQRFHRAEQWCLGMVATEDRVARRLDREITIFSEHDGTWHRVDEHHVLHLYDPDEVRSALEAVGMEVEVEPGYRSAGAHPSDLPGWYVVRARRPLT